MVAVAATAAVVEVEVLALLCLVLSLLESFLRWKQEQRQAFPTEFSGPEAEEEEESRARKFLLVMHLKRT